MKHTCATSGRSSCELCLLLEVDLWDAINRYAIAVGGDPRKHVHGNVPRMQAVADVGKIVAKVSSQQQIDDLVVEDLVKGSNAAAARACELQAANETLKQENARLVADLNLAGPDSACCRARHRTEEERDKLTADVGRLRSALREARVFLRGVALRPELGQGAKDLLDEADAIDRVLNGESVLNREMW